jgi:hypothetical protein
LGRLRRFLLPLSAFWRFFSLIGLAFIRRLLWLKKRYLLGLPIDKNDAKTQIFRYKNTKKYCFGKRFLSFFLPENQKKLPLKAAKKGGGFCGFAARKKEKEVTQNENATGVAQIRK